MLDTVTFLIHNVNKKIPDLSAPSGYSYYNKFYRLLYERLLDYESKFVIRSKKFLNEGQTDNIDNDDYFKRKSIDNIGFVKRQGGIIESLNKKEFFFYPVHGNITTASSDSTCKFSINENSDSLKFELSIPKYFYGHNIAQFVPNIESQRYLKNPFLSREFKHQASLVITRLTEFIATFLNDLSELLNIHNITLLNFEDIEVSRLDLCYNQFFESKAFAIDYLQAQKKIYHSRVKKNTKITSDYDSSFAYRHNTDGFYFKIYHKGAEFIENDSKKILKINKDALLNENTLNKANEIYLKYFPVVKQKKHFSFFSEDENKNYNLNSNNVQDEIIQKYVISMESKENLNFVKELETVLPFSMSFLLNEADKVLRYEMSFTRKYLSTLYKNKIFRKDCKDWSFLLKQHALVQRYYKYLCEDKIKASQFKRIRNIDSTMLQEHKIIERSLSKKHEFFLFTDSKIKNHESKINFFDHMSYRKDKHKFDFIEIKKATFSKDLMNLIFNKFKEEIDFFQIKEVVNNLSLTDRIEKYNELAKTKSKQYINAFGEANYKKLTHTDKRKLGLSQLRSIRLKIVIDKMNQGMSLNEALDFLNVKTSSRYVFIQDLEKFDIFKNSVKTKYTFRNIKTDFSKYYENFLIDRNYAKRFFHNSKLISFDVLRQTALHTSFFK
ncbi:hypothetical protein [Flavobacterium sp. HNIBRBA15423]|uniref:hypothetical protein n=1 Tax=Flavobacterium sp. HNIBRBA15423 TaxID=3458683 RepID=UPI0040440283